MIKKRVKEIKNEHNKQIHINYIGMINILDKKTNLLMINF